MIEDLVALGPDQLAVFCDYDGTLAPIVDRPEDAVPAPGANEALTRVVATGTSTAVVSGRPIEFLRTQLDVDGLVLIGQYGLERLVDAEIVVDARVRASAPSLEAARLEAEERWPDLLVEHKGDVAFTVHWRTAPDRDVTDDVVALAEHHSLVAVPGKMACEVRPPIDVDKGSVVRSMLHGYAGAVVIGDDRGDLSAFAALDVLDVALRVGVDSPEAPPELVDAVDLMVGGPGEVVALLDDLATRLTA